MHIRKSFDAAVSAASIVTLLAAGCEGGSSSGSGASAIPNAVTASPSVTPTISARPAGVTPSPTAIASPVTSAAPSYPQYFPPYTYSIPIAAATPTGTVFPPVESGSTTLTVPGLGQVDVGFPASNAATTISGVISSQRPANLAIPPLPSLADFQHPVAFISATSSENVIFNGALGVDLRTSNTAYYPRNTNFEYVSEVYVPAIGSWVFNYWSTGIDLDNNGVFLDTFTHNDFSFPKNTTIYMELYLQQ